MILIYIFLSNQQDFIFITLNQLSYHIQLTLNILYYLSLWELIEIFLACLKPYVNPNRKDIDQKLNYIIITISIRTNKLLMRAAQTEMPIDPIFILYIHKV